MVLFAVDQIMGSEENSIYHPVCIFWQCIDKSGKDGKLFWGSDIAVYDKTHKLVVYDTGLWPKYNYN